MCPTSEAASIGSNGPGSSGSGPPADGVKSSPSNDPGTPSRQDSGSMSDMMGGYSNGENVRVLLCWFQYELYYISITCFPRIRTSPRPSKRSRRACKRRPSASRRTLTITCNRTHTLLSSPSSLVHCLKLYVLATCFFYYLKQYWCFGKDKNVVFLSSEKI